MRRAAPILAALCACATPVAPHGVPNLRQVDPHILRGGQPTAAGWTYLRSRGVRCDVKLDYSEPEGAPAGIAVTVASMPPADLAGEILHPIARNLLRAPSRAELHRALAPLLAGCGVVYIHCTHGQDRTGLVVAMYRVLKDGWSPARARAEMLDDGYHPDLRGLEEAWEAFVAEPKESP